MRGIDSPGARRELAEPDSAGATGAAGHSADLDGADLDAAAADLDGADLDAAAADAAGDAPGGRPDDLRQRLEALRASHPSSPGYGGHHGGRGAAGWPPRGGDPYRPWFSAGDPAEPWFTADPGDPPG
jgi:hypothetical protein